MYLKLVKNLHFDLNSKSKYICQINILSIIIKLIWLIKYPAAKLYLQHMYAKFFKELITRKRNLDDTEIIALTEECSAVIQNHMPKKLGDPGSFCIPCVVGKKSFTALCDLGSSVSVLPLGVTQSLKLGTLKPTSVTLQLADRTLRKPADILEDLPVQVANFAYPVDFVILEMDDNADTMILGRPFLATAGAIIDVKGGKLKFQFGTEQAEFYMKHASHQQAAKISVKQ